MRNKLFLIPFRFLKSASSLKIQGSSISQDLPFNLIASQLKISKSNRAEEQNESEG